MLRLTLELLTCFKAKSHISNSCNSQLIMQYMVARGSVRKLKRRKGAEGIHMRHTGSGEGGGLYNGGVVEYGCVCCGLEMWKGA